MEIEPIENAKIVSYLVARDPSLISGCISKSAPKKKLYDIRETIVIKDEVGDSEEINRLNIYLRLKRTDLNKASFVVQDEQNVVCIVPDHIHNVKTIKNGQVVQKKFQFSKIFKEDTAQSEIFNEILKPKVVRFINGYNSNILSYGASGSGKTFTIMGTPEEPGLIPRSLDYIFRTIKPEIVNSKLQVMPNGSIKRLSSSEMVQQRIEKMKILNSSAATPKYNFQMEGYREMRKRLSSLPVATLDSIPDGVSVSIWLSFVEIYNDDIYDLLIPIPQRGQKRQKLQIGNCGDHPYVKNLTSVSVSTSEEAYQILQYGLHNLKYAATGVNQHSSRSHCIFSLQLVQASDLEEGYNVSYFNFCDLAGSERLKKTNNVGDRLKESNNINNSLMNLGRCISAVRENQKSGTNKIVPYRDSKLTQLFRRALSGQEDIAMVVTINPDISMFEETQHVLNFSAIAKEIIVNKKQDLLNDKNSMRFTSVQARSTAYSSDDQVKQLLDLVADLEYENEQLQIKMDQQDEDLRKELMEFHERVVKEERQNHERHILRLQNSHKNELRRMEALYKHNLNNRVVEIVDLDSSSEESDEMKEKLRRYEDELRESQKTISDLRAQLIVLEGKLYNCEAKLDECQKEKNDALASFLEAEENNKELNNIVSQQSEMLAQKNAMIDKLEDKLVSLGIVLEDDEAV